MMSAALFAGCTSQTEQKAESDNPFFAPYGTPFEVPAFDKIKIADYMPAFKAGMEEQMKEVDAIVKNQEAASFENTVAALDASGQLLSKVSGVFFNLTEAATNDDMQAIAKEVSPLLSQHNDKINMNAQLFERINTLYNKRSELNLNTEQTRLLEKFYTNFVRGGANLEADKQQRFSAINQELSLLSLQFGENQLNETNNWEMVITDKAELAGLPQGIIAAAADAAKERGHEGAWVFTLHKPSMIPFLQYAENRALREKIFTAYINRANNDNENDNKAVITKIVNLNIERAHLLGYDSPADYVLDNNMAKTPANVFAKLMPIWEAALPMAKNEVKELQKMIDAENGGFKLAPYDWWFYAEKLRKAKYDLDEEQLRPYFELENVRNGAFAVAGKLYGLQFTERKDLPVYHDEARAFEVKEADGKHVGILYMDFHPRASKRSGAWMEAFRKQNRVNRKETTPIITVVCNFSKPTGDTPALLTFEEVTTLFHEFGHALHGLLSNCTYNTLSGTSVARDFVELPSQIMENWASEPEVLNMYAHHYKTGEVIPQELVDKVQKAAKFNQGFITVEYLSAALLDMQYHILNDKLPTDVATFEKETLDKMGLIPEIVVRYRSTYFGHIFGGGYSAGYYSYIWAAVLDADAFHAFKENGIFDPATAKAFRTNVLERGGTEDPMKLYTTFRGQEPSINPLLERKGLL